MLENTSPSPANQELAAQVAVISEPQSKLPDSAHARNPVDEWFALIHPEFAQGNACHIAGALKLAEARLALKKTKGSFVELIERLGLDLDKAERLMKIARHSVLADSAHARSLPTSWMTLYTLAALPPAILLGFLQDGTVHPRLQRKEAERLVHRVRGSNSRGAGQQQGGDEPVAESVETVTTKQAAGQMEAAATGPVVEQTGTLTTEPVAETINTEEPVLTDASALPPAQTLAQRDDIGPGSQLEVDCKLARGEELEHEVLRLRRQLTLCERRIEELAGKLGVETDVPYQRRLFARALRAASKTNTPSRDQILKDSVAADLIELARSAVRDGLKPERFDLHYRPELH